MKAFLKFDLADPSERLEHRRAISATDSYICLHQIAEEIFRRVRKYGNHSEEVLNVVESMERQFYEILETYGVDLNDLE